MTQGDAVGTPTIGTRLGAYVLVRQLGAGGMGMVFLAEHALLNSFYALKLLDPELTQRQDIVARFINEARAAAKIQHPNLIRVHHIDQAPDGTWYMVLDYLEGQTLAKLITEHRGPLPPHLIVRVLAQVASCMHRVHKAEIVHRDLKPENLFIVARGDNRHFVIVLDLGVAQVSQALLLGPRTRTGTVIGTVTYMAPEQLRGEHVTPAADIFALGVIAYEMATGGSFPFQQRDEDRLSYVQLSAPELYHRHRTPEALDPLGRLSGIPKQLAQVIRGALDPDPRRRPRDARAFAHALAEAVPTDGIEPDGLEILRRVAPDLMTADEMLETIRAPGPAVQAASAAPSEPRNTVLEKPDRSRQAGTPRRGTPHVVREAPHAQVAAPAVEANGPATTLGGSASQAVQRTRSKVRWPVVATVGSLVVAAGAVALFAIDRDHPTPSTTRQDAGSTDRTVAVVQPATPVTPDAGPATTVAQPPARIRVAPDAAHVVAAVHLAVPTRGAPDAGTAAGPVASVTPDAARAASHAAASNAHPRPAISPVPHGTGTLAVHVRPWAMIWIDGRSVGQTPFEQKLSAGPHRVRLVNDDAGKHENLIVTVKADQTMTIERTW